MFIPTTPRELTELGWDSLDAILVSGDTYIDTPYSGIAIIGHQLLAAGYKVAIIAQPAVDNGDDITRLGEPRLFWGVTAGLIDSLVANTTALGKPRQYDDHTPGGINNRRPDRATIVYSNLIRRFFKNTVPIVLGGIEASLRRVVHYDFWSDSLRRSVLLDAKADYLMYGMADLTVLELAETLRLGGDPRFIRGLCYSDSKVPESYVELPSFEAVQADKTVFTRMFHIFYQNMDPISAQGLAQRYADRYVIQNPPSPTLTTEQMDAIYALPFEHTAHPYYSAQGEIKALETIRFSIPTHRGCYGECNFCAIAVHEGRRVSWRSEESIVEEALLMSNRPGFSGIIHDLSGPTANMYGFECRVKALRGACQDKSCIYPQVCPLLGVNHEPQTSLLRKLRQLPNVRKVFVGSGIRYDMVSADAESGDAYMEELTVHHVSGQLKLAPEHSELNVLRAMRKPGTKTLLGFKETFDQISASENLPQFLSYYMIAAHPGCTQQDMIQLRKFSGEVLGVLPEQVQIFTPTPSTYSSLMYYTEHDPWTGEEIFVEKDTTEKMRQKASITGWNKQKRGNAAERVSMNESENRPKNGKRRFQHDDSSKPNNEITEVGPDGLKWKKVGETRVIKDDYAHFFNNKLPEGWVDKRDRPSRPLTHNRPNPTRRRWEDGNQSGREANTTGSRNEGEGVSNSNPETQRTYRPRTDSDRGSYSRPSGDRPYRPRTEGERGSYSRPSGDRPYRPRTEGDRPYKPRTEGESSYKPRSEGERGSYSRPSGDRPYRPRTEGDRPYKPRTEGDNSYKPRSEGDRGSYSRPSGDRPYRPRTEGDRPYKPRTEGDNSYKPRSEGDRGSYSRPSGDRPYRPRAEGDRSYKPRSEGDRGSYSRPSGDRPYRPRTEGDRSYKPRSEGDRDSSSRPSGDRPYRPRAEGNRSTSDSFSRARNNHPHGGSRGKSGPYSGKSKNQGQSDRPARSAHRSDDRHSGGDQSDQR